MAPLTCPVCAAPVRQGDLICINCGANLARREAPAAPGQSYPQQDQQQGQGQGQGQYPPQDQYPPQGAGFPPPPDQQYPPQGQYPQQGQYPPPQEQAPHPSQQQGTFPPQDQQPPFPPQAQQPYGQQPPYPPQDQQPPYPPHDQQPHGQQPGYPPQDQQPHGQQPPYPPQDPQSHGQQPPYPPQDPQSHGQQPGYPPQDQQPHGQQPPYPPQDQQPQYPPQPQGYGGGGYGAPPAGGPGAPHIPPPPREPTMTGGDSTSAYTPFCPHCGAEVPDVGNPVCVQCLRPLHDQGQGGPPQQLTLVVQFGSGELTVPAGQELVLGRDPVQSPVASTFSRFDNVSRRHAVVGVDGGGQAWVRDERSTNGTFLNDRRLGPGEQASLRDGDSLRLAADARGQVRLAR